MPPCTGDRPAERGAFRCASPTELRRLGREPETRSGSRACECAPWAAAAWHRFKETREAIEWADAIHLTGGNGSMEFPALVPADKPIHLHFLESKPGIHDDVSHLNPDGSGGWMSSQGQEGSRRESSRKQVVVV